MHRLSPCSLEAAALALGPDAVDVDADAADASGIPLFQYMLQGSSSASLFSTQTLKLESGPRFGKHYLKRCANA